MNSIKLNNGNKIPQIGLGVYLTPENVTRSVIINALNLGYKHVDSAAAYKNELQVCEAISEWLEKSNAKREDVHYTTKIWNDDQGYDNAKKAIEFALKKAESIDYIDLILVHSPLTNYEKRHGT